MIFVQPGNQLLLIRTQAKIFEIQWGFWIEGKRIFGFETGFHKFLQQLQGRCNTGSWPGYNEVPVPFNIRKSFGL